MNATSAMGVASRVANHIPYSRMRNTMSSGEFSALSKSAGFIVQRVTPYGYLPRPGRLLPRFCEVSIEPAERAAHTLRIPPRFAKNCCLSPNGDSAAWDGHQQVLQGFGAMIVEVFGRAGAGKTTFAHALRERLSANGHTARVVLSYQPGMEVSSLDPGGAIAAICRVARAIIATLVIVARPIARKTELSLAFGLVVALPPTNIIWFIRLAQYVLRLCQRWSLWSGAEDIIIFDQRSSRQFVRLL